MADTPGAAEFRSPVAAGMLTGVLAGAASVLLFRVFYANLMYRSDILNFLLQFPCNLLICCGPALCRRDGALLRSAGRWTFVILIAKFFLSLIPHFPFGYRASYGPILLSIFRSVLTGGIYGFAIGRMYRLKSMPWLVVPAGMLAVAVWILPSLLYYFATPNKNTLADSNDYMAIQTMSQLTGYVLLGALPAWVVESEMQREIENTSYFRSPDET